MPKKRETVKDPVFHLNSLLGLNLPMVMRIAALQDKGDPYYMADEDPIGSFRGQPMYEARRNVGGFGSPVDTLVSSPFQFGVPPEYYLLSRLRALMGSGASRSY